MLKNRMDGLIGLLSYLKRHETNVLVQELRNRFSSESKVFCAPVSDLNQITELDSTDIVLIRLTAALKMRRRCLHPLPENVGTDLDSMKKFCCSKMSGLELEMLMVFYLDQENIPVDWNIFCGIRDNIFFSCVQLLHRMIRCDATKMIIAHNHPDGSAAFSPEDFKSTRKLSALLEYYHCRLTDHWLVTPGGCISMKATLTPKQRESIFSADTEV